MAGGSAGSVRFYGPAQVRAALDYHGCIAAVRNAMAEFSAGGEPQPLRSIIEMGPGKQFGLMPGALGAPHGFGAKVLSVFADPQQPGRLRAVAACHRQARGLECGSRSAGGAR